MGPVINATSKQVDEKEAKTKNVPTKNVPNFEELKY